MAVGIGIGAHGIMAGMSVPLLDDKKQPTNIINHFYVPLTEVQADLYMKREVYTDYLKKKIDSLYFYHDKNNIIQPKFYKDIKTHEIKRLTVKDISKRRKSAEENIKKQDKEILLTEGIGALQEAKGIWHEESDASKTCGKICLIFVGIIFPCFLPCICYQTFKEEKGELKDVPDITIGFRDKSTGKYEIETAKACLKYPISVD